MDYKVSATTVNIDKNTTVRAERKYGAWMCVNIGSAVANVMGYNLQPGEGLDFLSAVPAGSMWDAPIQVIVNPGAVVRLTRLQYMPIKEEE